MTTRLSSGEPWCPSCRAGTCGVHGRMRHCTPTFGGHSPLCDRDGTYCSLASTHVGPCKPHGDRELRYGYGEAGHPFDPDRYGRCRKAGSGYCDGTRQDTQHDLRQPGSANCALCGEFISTNGADAWRDGHGRTRCPAGDFHRP